MRSTRPAIGLGLLLAGVALSAPSLAQQPQLRLSTNQSYIEESLQRGSLPIADTRAMFSIILASLPERVKVYPTENYYYFSFLEAGVRYAGNFRLDASNRDAGKVHFAYYQDLQEWSGSEQINYLMLDSSHGVSVKKTADLVYEVGDGKKTVIFELNDLRGVKPPEGMILADERYIGPIFDESGMRFFLIYNSARKLFHYVLDETAPLNDLLEPLTSTDRITVGRRTGFAYYRDHRYNRKILIGVYEANARVNNYFDGPFDQLPDNFIEGESLRSALLEIDPRMKGRIDRFGGSPGGGDRYMIAPYRHYRFEDDLLSFHNCTTWPQLKPEVYADCFVYVDASQLPPEEPAARPANTKKKSR